MKTILTGLIAFLKKAFSKEYLPITMGIIIIILIILMFSTCNRLSEEKLNHKKDIAMYENNLTAQNDSIRTYYDKKIGMMISEKTSYLVKSVDDLKKYNEDMYNDFKNMKNMVAGIQSTVGVIVPKLTSEINKIKQDPNDSNKYTIPWQFTYSDAGLNQNLIGYSNFTLDNQCKPYGINSTLDTNIFNIKLRYAVTEEKGKYLIKAFSPSNLVKFTELDGALTLDKMIPDVTTPNKWAFGPYVGIGLNTDMTGQNSRFGWSIGFSATYNIFAKKTGSKGIKNLFRKTVLY